MYVLPQYDEQRTEVLRALIGAQPFATLAIAVDGEVVANHVPVLFRPDNALCGTIVGHIAKANPI